MTASCHLAACLSWMRETQLLRHQHRAVIRAEKCAVLLPVKQVAADGKMCGVAAGLPRRILQGVRGLLPCRQTMQLSYESSSEEEADNAEVWAEAKKPKRRQV